MVSIKFYRKEGSGEKQRSAPKRERVRREEVLKGILLRRKK